MKKIELAIFDYDGVIVDSFKTLHLAYGQICKELGGKYKSDINQFKKDYMASTNHLLFMEGLGITSDKHAQADVIYKREQTKLETPLFSGIEEVLTEISNSMSMIIVSSNHTSEIVNRLSKDNLLRLFDNILGNETDGTYFHKTRPIRAAIREFGLSSNSVVSVGDRTRDFFYAVEAGIPAENIILVDYGWGYDEQKIKSAGYCLETKVDSPIKILDALEEIRQK